MTPRKEGWNWNYMIGVLFWSADFSLAAFNIEHYTGFSRYANVFGAMVAFLLASMCAAQVVIGRPKGQEGKA
jgi:hypothetical protein